MTAILDPERLNAIVVAVRPVPYGDWETFCRIVKSVRYSWEAINFHSHYVRFLAQALAGSELGDEDIERIARSIIGYVYGEGMTQHQVNLWYHATGALHPQFGARLPTTRDHWERLFVDGQKVGTWIKVHGHPLNPDLNRRGVPGGDADSPAAGGGGPVAPA